MAKTSEHETIWKNFRNAVNMTPKEMQDWLDGEQSKQVGQIKPGEAESIGRKSGKRILKILKTKKTDLADDDFTHMRKVVSYVRRHLAQEPRNIETSRWRYSLMNWGHDPIKARFKD